MGSIIDTLHSVPRSLSPHIFMRHALLSVFLCVFVQSKIFLQHLMQHRHYTHIHAIVITFSIIPFTEIESAFCWGLSFFYLAISIKERYFLLAKKIVLQRNISCGFLLDKKILHVENALGYAEIHKLISFQLTRGSFLLGT